MISPFKLSAAPELVAVRKLGIDHAALYDLAKAGKIRVFRGRGGAKRYDVAAYPAAQARPRPHRLYWRDQRKTS